MGLKAQDGSKEAQDKEKAPLLSNWAHGENSGSSPKAIAEMESPRELKAASSAQMIQPRELKGHRVGNAKAEIGMVKNSVEHTVSKYVCSFWERDLLFYSFSGLG